MNNCSRQLEPKLTRKQLNVDAVDLEAKLEKRVDLLLGGFLLLAGGRFLLGAQFRHVQPERFCGSFLGYGRPGCFTLRKNNGVRALAISEQLCKHSFDGCNILETQHWHILKSIFE